MEDSTQLEVCYSRSAFIQKELGSNIGKFNLLSSIYKGFEKNSFVHNKVIIFIAKRNYHVDFFKLTMNSFSCR